MKKLFIILSVLIVASAVVGCGGDKAKYEELENWYANIIEEINENANSKGDSIEYITEDNRLYITHYANSKKLFKEYRSIDTLEIYVRIKYG